MGLSERRAKTIFDSLKGKGVPAGQLVKHYGVSEDECTGGELKSDSKQVGRDKCKAASSEQKRKDRKVVICHA